MRELLSRTIPTPWIIPRASSIVTSRSVSARPSFGITRSISVVKVASPTGFLSRAVAGIASRVARTLPRSVTISRSPETVPVSAVTERRGLSGSVSCERRRGEIDAVVVRKMLGAGCGEHLAHAAVDVEAHRAEALDVEIGVVPRRSVVAPCGRLHLRVEPVRERREAPSSSTGDQATSRSMRGRRGVIGRQQHQADGRRTAERRSRCAGCGVCRTK